MPIAFNHSILAARDRHASAAFLASLFGLPEPTTWGPFAIVRQVHGVTILFAEPNVAEIQMQHYAFLVDAASFDAIYQCLQDRDIDHWADPQATKPGQINTNHGGRGVYFHDPAGHAFEVLTRAGDSAA